MAEDPRSQKRAKVEVAHPSPSSPLPLPRYLRSPQAVPSPASTDPLPSSHEPVSDEVHIVPSSGASEHIFNSVDTRFGAGELHSPERDHVLEAISRDSSIREGFVVEETNNTLHPRYDTSVSERNDSELENSDSNREEPDPTSANHGYGARGINLAERNPFFQEVPVSASIDPNGENFLMEQTVNAVDHINGARDLQVSASNREEQVQASTRSEIANETITSSSVQQVIINIEDVDHPEPITTDPGKSPHASGEKDCIENAEAMTCSICMESWTSDGSHRIWWWTHSTLVVKPMYGMSSFTLTETIHSGTHKSEFLTSIRVACLAAIYLEDHALEDGLRNQERRTCPHCNRKARIEDIRNLYVPSLVVVDQQLHEDLIMLRKRNEELVAQNVKISKELQLLKGLLADTDAPNESIRFHKGEGHTYDVIRDSGWNVLESSMTKGQRSKFSGYQCNIGAPDKMGYKRQQTIEAALSHHSGYTRETGRSTSQHTPYFGLQEEFSLLGARVFDMDALSQMILVAQKTSSGHFCLNKISLLSLSDKTIMPLPEGTGAVRDIRVAPPGGRLPGRLALVASLGKRLSLFSLESSNIVLTYTVQSPCWSCAWDPNEPNQVYAGCQDGSLTVFDLRQTSCPLRSIQGFSRQPVHTLQPLNEYNIPQSLRKNGILSACSSGVYFWEMTTSTVENCRPYPVPYVDSEGVCVALAYDHHANIAVSSFRSKPCITISNEIGSSGLSSQANSEVNLGSHTRAIHVPLSRSVTNCPEMQGGELSKASNEWRYGSPMFGYVSSIGMHKSAIVCKRRPNSSVIQSMFAFGDDQTHSVLLWDVNNLNVVGRLRSHGSPILDIKSMTMDAHSFIGCISATTLQIYKG